MVSLHARQFVLPRALDCEFWVKVCRCFGRCVFYLLIGAGVAFVIRSAMFAWNGKPFDLHEAIGSAAAFGFVFAIMPFVTVYLRRRNMPLLRKRIGLRRKWRECEEEVERLRSSKNER